MSSALQVQEVIAPLGVVHAAGAVVWRERGDRLEVALVHRPRYRDWSWPKGKVDPAESLPAAAVREVAEEIGSAIVLGVPLPSLRYRTPDGRGKLVRYWAARLATDDDAPAVTARGPVAQAPLAEIDDVVWVSAPTAADLLTRATDRAPLAVVENLWRRERLRTSVFAVARHGRARRRSAHTGDEETRPLTATGATQAVALVPVLSAFGIREVVTSPWERCFRTVEPYALRVGLPLDTVEALTESAHAVDPDKVVTIVRDHLADANGVVLSTHRPVLPAVMSAISRSTRRWTLGRVPSKDPYLRTGELLVVHVTGSGRAARVVAVEHQRPPRDRTDARGEG